MCDNYFASASNYVDGARKRDVARSQACRQFFLLRWGSVNEGKGLAMRLFRTTIVCALFGAAGCNYTSPAESSRQTEQSIAASCRRWDDYAQKAANPDAPTIAAHDRLIRKAADLQAAAAAQNLRGVERDTAIGEIAQIRVEADALYDARGKKQIADQCWAGLGVVRDMHYEMRQREMRAGHQIDMPQPAAAAPGIQAPASYQVPMPPAPPSPTPLSGLGSAYTPPSISPPPRFIPYEAVAPAMPGIAPDGTAR
jgi:hypothetical protein